MDIKQNKIQKPILLTSLWILYVIGMIISGIYAPLNLIVLLLWFFMMIYAFMGWLICISEWVSRHETRNMKKYIQTKINEKADEIVEAKQELEDLYGELDRY